MMENVSAVSVFILSGLNESMDCRMAVFSLTGFYYSVVLFLNFSLVVLIASDENLHEPMYVLLCCMCVNALYGTAGFYPRFLLDLLSTSREISLHGCLLQVFVIYSFACCDLSILAAMAYDRYLAICRPLHYQSLMTKARICQLVCFSWLTPFCICSVNILLTSRLRPCGSHIKRPFCINWILIQLACPDSSTLPNGIVSYVTIFIYVSHGFFIVWTYMHLIRTCVTSKRGRVKFMQTCVPHLISLGTFLLAILFDLMYLRFGSRDLPQSVQNFIAVGFLLFPPVMNPLIYGFKLAKVRHKIWSLIRVTAQ